MYNKRSTHHHACKALLLLHDIVHVRWNEGVEVIEVLLALLALGFRVELGLFQRELLKELDDSINERRRLASLLLATDNGTGDKLSQLREQPMERRAIHERLEHDVSEAHVS